MSGFLRFRRILLVAVVSVVLFIACGLAVLGPANGTLPGRLLAKHEQARCEQCHAVGSLTAANLAAAMPPLMNEQGCVDCHNQPENGLFFIRQDPGEKVWRIRKAHTGEPGWARLPPGGMIAAEADRLAVPLTCGTCHLDHHGERFTQKQGVPIKASEGPTDFSVRQVVVMQEVCISCHIPAGEGSLAKKVRDNFIEKHGDGNCFVKGQRFPLGSGREAILMAMNAPVQWRKDEDGKPKPDHLATCVSCHSEHHPKTGSGSDAEERAPQQ